MTLWAKAFEKLYHDVKIEIEATGSATAPAALLEGTSQFGPMSRPMTATEAAAFEEKYGYEVSSFRVAVDALAVYVNKDNPISCLTIRSSAEFLVKPQGSWQRQHQDVGRPWPDRRMGGTADCALQPQCHFRDLRVFSGNGSLRRRIQA